MPVNEVGGVSVTRPFNVNVDSDAGGTGDVGVVTGVGDVSNEKSSPSAQPVATAPIKHNIAI
jgi:hypothetical protein